MSVTRLILWLAALALIPHVLAVLLAARPRPVPPLDAPGFEACALPCWAGITPGETRTQESPQIMSAHLPDTPVVFSQIGTQINFNTTRTERSISGSIYDDRGTVGGLRLMMRLPLWQILELLGTPACVSQQPEASAQRFVTIRWALENHSIGVTLLLEPAEWNISAEIFSLAVFSRDAPCSSPAEISWQGFAPLWFYQAKRAG